LPGKKPPSAFSDLNAHGAASKFGQLIGEAFAKQVVFFIRRHLAEVHPEFIVLEAQKGRRIVRLGMLGGTLRQMDNVIVPKNSESPVALFESKWLKDARHHNDKGAWILQLREISKKYATVRGAVAILAGYWTDGVSVMFGSEAGVKTVLVATDQQVYDTLQVPLDAYLNRLNRPLMRLDAETLRGSLPRASELANFIIDLAEREQLAAIADTWFTLNLTSQMLTGGDKIKVAIDSLLVPLPTHPQIKTLEITLQIETGNIIHRKFQDAEEAMAFIQAYFNDPALVLSQIMPQITIPPPSIEDEIDKHDEP
jgi:hypothetical protein